MKTLPDFLRKDLDIVSVGLNPSINSVKAGFYFATPQNRFWKALNASRLVDEALTPSAAAVEILFERYAIGFTDVVKRPSSSGNQLRAADYKEWAPVLRDTLIDCAPRIVWFHGKVAYGNFVKYTAGGTDGVPWGRQQWRIGKAIVYVTPNPSPANAAFSLQEITRWLDRLAGLRDRVKRKREE